MRIAFVWIFVASQLAYAQDVRVIRDKPSCASCRIELRQAVTVGGFEDSAGLIAQTSRVARNSRSNHMIGPTENPGEILVFDQRGKLTMRFGKPGNGPGEFTWVRSLIVGRGDSVLVYDGSNGRLTVFTPDLKYGRSLVLASNPYDLVHLREGRVVAQFMARSADLIGYPIHLIDASGRVIRSFGSRDAAYSPSDPMARFRAIAVDPEGIIWSAHHNRYEIEAWDTLGNYRGTLRRNVDWFRPWKLPDTGPAPTLRSLWHDGRYLWVLITVQDLSWKGPFPDPFGPNEYHKVWDTMLEVIDPRTGELVASQRFPNLMERINEGIVHSINEYDGVLRAQVMQLHLKR